MILRRSSPFLLLLVLHLISPLFGSEEYAKPESCIECHGEVHARWSASDHSKSMAHATSESVLGDFNDAEFLHIGFDDIALLDDSEVQTFLHALENAPPRKDPRREYFSGEEYPALRYNIAGRKMKFPVDPHFDDLALASMDAKPETIEKLRQSMSSDRRKKFDEEHAFRQAIRINRPGDVAAAQDRIDEVLRLLVASKNIKTAVGTRFRMFRDGERFMVETDIGPKEIRFTLGVRPLQQYLVETAGGRVQCLPVAWDSIEKRWFHLYPKEQIPENDPLHWTKSLQNWNRMCADCHTTNLQKNFELKPGTPGGGEYKTTFDEINVSCQACHGPCGEHDRVARKHDFKEKWNGDVPKHVHLLAGDPEPKIVESCVFCHARRRLLRQGPKAPEIPSWNWFVPESVDGNIYFPDGQLLEESFEYGSVMQSKMFSKGVGCTNCHEAHSVELRFQGNRLCTQCHSPSIYDTARHHFHPDASKPGTQCVECHFPQSTYMVVDPRRDHSIRKPSPALTILTGTPNACTICHQDRAKGETLEWARDRVDRWYAEKRQATVGYSDLWPTDAHYALAIAAGRREDPQAVNRLLAVVRDKSAREFRPPIRAAALTLLSRFPAEPTLVDRSFSACVNGLADADPWVRFASVGALAVQPDDVKLKHLPALLDDPALAVRCEAARVLAGVSSKFSNEKLRTAFEKAKAEYIASQRVDSDQPATYLNLAVLEQDLAGAKINDVNLWFHAGIQGLPPTDPTVPATRQKAIELIERLTKPSLEYYRQSIELDPDFLPSRINLAMLYHQRGNDTAAEKEFLEALRIDPKSGDTAYSLGLLYAELGRTDDAEKMLRTASANFENLADRRSTRNRVRYNLALLLMGQGKRDDAQKELVEIARAEPENVAFLHALAVLYLQKGEKIKASKIIDRLIKLEPDNPNWRQMKSRS